MFGSQSTCAHDYLVGRKRTKLFERFLSLVIAAALSLSLMPHSAWADGDETVVSSPASIGEAEALAPASDSYVFIQDEQDKDGTDRVEGTIGSGAVLWANLHDFYSDDAIAHEDTWAYQWFAGPDRSSNVTSYVPIEGQTSQRLEITDQVAEQLSGSYIVVRITADGRDYYGPGYYGIATYSVPGPVMMTGAVDIYSAFLSNGESSTYVYAVGETVTAWAKEKGSSDPIDPEKLTYRWLVSSDGETFAEIPGATEASLSLGEDFRGKYVKCVLTARIGGSTCSTRATNAIAAAGSINVTSVRLDKTGKLHVGDVITATAEAATGDVTDNERVTWSWYRGGSAYGTDTKIEGATGNVLVVTDTLLGAYLEARADGGYGEEDSSAAGPVVRPGSVELYRVEASGSPRVGSTLTATAYEGAGSEVSDDAVVDYQWQYAETNTTMDSAFKDIPGATGRTYIVGDTIDGASSLGRYLRVKATSDGNVVSTERPSYYGSSSVDPIGPLMLEGAYELSSVRLTSSGQGVQAGNTITPKAQVRDGYYEEDAPADAKVVYSWWILEDDGCRPLTDGVSVDGSLVLSSDLVGRQMKVSANALVEGNEPESASFTVLSEGEYDLLRVTFSPDSDDLFTGDEITAKVQARNLASVSYGDDVTDEVDLVWSIADSADGVFVPLTDVSTGSIRIPPDAAGKYLKITAFSGSSSVSAVTSDVVVASDSLEAAAKKLEGAYFKPDPVYGEDDDINRVVEEKLDELGYDDVTVRTKSAEPLRTDDNATVGVSAADDEGNGRVTYFFMDPDEASSTYLSYTQLRQMNLVFTLSRGEETYEYSPSHVGTIPWDEERVVELLEQKASALAPGLAPHDEMDSVTQDLTLPNKLSDDDGDTRYWSDVSWASSDDSVVEIDGWGWSDYTGTITRTTSDRTVELTATVSAGGISSSGGPDATIEKTFVLTVKGDPEKVAVAKADLERKVQANFTYENIGLSETDDAVDWNAVTGDLTLPRPGIIGVDGKYYEVAYSTSNDAVEVNGWAGRVYRPLPGDSPVSVGVTATVTDKSNSEITASKTLPFTIVPLEQDDIDRELALMEAAKAGYFTALANGQDVEAVTGNLHAFQKAYYDARGDLAWTYDYASTDEVGDGIVPTDLEGYDPMGSAGWRLFRSSRPSVVSHENLLVNQPEFNTKVTVASCLTSQKYARYVQRYPDDQRFRHLANQNISATFTVRGTTGADDPNAGDEYSVTARVTGISEQAGEGVYETEAWVPLTEVTLPGDEDTTAWDVFSRLLDAAGCTYARKSDDGSLTGDPFSITKDDRTLAMSGDGKRYWAFFINGEYANEYASTTSVHEGDSLELRYVDDTAVELPPDGVEVNPDADHPDLDVEWGGYLNGGRGSVVQDADTPTEGADAAWTFSLLTDEERAEEARASVSDPFLIGGKLYVVTSSSMRDPETMAMVRGPARLIVIDPTTGLTERQMVLATSMDSTCRPAYDDGIVVIPLSGGYLQAISASTLETIWVADGIAGAQSLSTMTVSDDYVYVETVDSLGVSSLADSGTIRRFNLHTGALAGEIQSDSTGYYWSGGVVVNGFYVVPDDSGRIAAYTSDLSQEVGSVQVGDAPLRTTLVADGEAVYAVSRDGALCRVLVGDDGALTEAGRVSFAAYSTSTPTIFGGRVYVGGSTSDHRGLLAIVDLDTMGVVQIARADGEEFPAEVKSSPLVSVRNGQTRVYFTCNASPGGVYAYLLGDEEASSLYAPTGVLADYCLASVFAGEDGTLYYSNDSGYLFALRATADDGAGGDDPDYQGNDSNEPTSPVMPFAKMIVSDGPASRAYDPPSGTTLGKEVFESQVNPSLDAQDAIKPSRNGDDSSKSDPVGMSPWTVVVIILVAAGIVIAVAFGVRSGRRGGTVHTGKP